MALLYCLVGGSNENSCIRGMTKYIKHLKCDKCDKYNIYADLGDLLQKRKCKISH